MNSKVTIRLRAIEALGGRCQWHEGCSITDPDMLDIAHVNGNGKQHRLQHGKLSKHPTPGTKGTPSSSQFDMSSTYYTDILNNANSGNFTVLCANHHRKLDANKRREKQAIKEGQRYGEASTCPKHPDTERHRTSYKKWYCPICRKEENKKYRIEHSVLNL